MQALTNEDNLEHYRVSYCDHKITIKNEFGSGWNFFADEHADPQMCAGIWPKLPVP
jgi:hypothetical protein